MGIGEWGFLFAAGLLLAAMTASLAAAQDTRQPGPGAPATDSPPVTEAPAPRVLPVPRSPYLPNEVAPTAPSVPEGDKGGNLTPPAAAPLLAAPPVAPEECSAPARNFRQRWHYHTQSVFWGFPSQFRAPPLGYFMRAHGETEVANGTAVRMTLYHYDFVDGSNVLNLHGRDQLAKIAAMLPHNFFPIVIERTPEAPGLAEARRLAVLNELACGPFPVPAERVIIGPSLGDDLRGVEAELMNFNIMTQTRARGFVPGGGGGPTGPAAVLGGGAGIGGAGVGGAGVGGGR